MIELAEWESAEPNKCGSCKYFKRTGGSGLCSLKLPPWAMRMFWSFQHEKEHEIDQRTVHDTDDCSLYEVLTIDGKPEMFEQKRKWQAGSQPGQVK